MEKDVYLELLQIIFFYFSLVEYTYSWLSSVEKCQVTQTTNR